jgi:hypothetical protein
MSIGCLNTFCLRRGSAFRSGLIRTNSSILTKASAITGSIERIPKHRPNPLLYLDSTSFHRSFCISVLSVLLKSGSSSRSGSSESERSSSEYQKPKLGFKRPVPMDEIVGVVAPEEVLEAVRRTESRPEIAVKVSRSDLVLHHPDLSTLRPGLR